MRHTHRFALTAVATTIAAAIASSASAQGTRSSDARSFVYRGAGEDTPRAALGVFTTPTGTARDTLGLLITSLTRGGPAEKAGLEEGNRIAAINGVSLRASSADVEDFESAGTLSHRLVRELAKVKPGDAVELRVYRDGRLQPVSVRTVSSDSLFKRNVTFRRVSNDDFENRPAIGINIGGSSSRRDTLGVLVIGVQDSSPAARAGLEEGNRIAAINGISLRVSREDAGEQGLGHAKAERLRREVSQLKPNDNVTLRVYANGQFRDVTMKVARAKDLPRWRTSMLNGEGFFPGMPPRPPMEMGGVMAPMPPMAPMSPGRMELDDMSPIQFEIGPEMREKLRDVRVELERVRPQLNKIRMELPRVLEKISIPSVRVRFDAGANGMEL